jgi:hypothetical protein
MRPKVSPASDVRREHPPTASIQHFGKGEPDAIGVRRRIAPQIP